MSTRMLSAVSNFSDGIMLLLVLLVVLVFEGLEGREGEGEVGIGAEECWYDIC